MYHKNDYLGRLLGLERRTRKLSETTDDFDVFAQRSRDGVSVRSVNRALGVGINISVHSGVEKALHIANRGKHTKKVATIDNDAKVISGQLSANSILDSSRRRHNGVDLLNAHPLGVQSVLRIGSRQNSIEKNLSAKRKEEHEKQKKKKKKKKKKDLLCWTSPKLNAIFWRACERPASLKSDGGRGRLHKATCFFFFFFFKKKNESNPFSNPILSLTANKAQNKRKPIMKSAKNSDTV